MEYGSAEEIFEEIRQMAPKSYGGMTYQRLGIDGLQWPCPSTDHPGTPILHTREFTRGKGKFHGVDYQAPAELPDEDYPYALTTGRMFAHFHTGTMTRISKKLDNEQPTGYVSIHPEDAARLDITAGDPVRLSSRRGEMEAPARITRSVPIGTLFLPIHFGENPTNVLTSAETFDPLAKIPEFKVAAVRVEKLSGQKEL
jgi:predicted molibdopterin-dependent oxidoreductase YjgC